MKCHIKEASMFLCNTANSVTDATQLA